ncbi:MAG TPA: SOS response-associated peptidase [Bacteroidales bacterium]|nr:SOS response-associated peptidase [Bacteroidales bacterium]
MCGRFSFAISDKIIEEHFGFVPVNNQARYNCAPSQLLAVISNRHPERFSYFQWGFVPNWAKDFSVGNKMINARAETITSKPAFKRALQTNRCLVPADSFYEWSHDSEKTPCRVMLREVPLFSMAGIWGEWTAPGNEIITTFAILTTESNILIKQLHHRMPVIFDTKEAENTWLNSSSVAELQALCAPLAAEKMLFYPVSKKLNSPKNNVPDLHQSINQASLF